MTLNRDSDRMLKGKEISEAKSITLDILRIVAAMTVLVHHAIIQWGFSIYVNKDWGHTAVIVFFVLSGYVIAYTTFKNKRGWKEYAQARLSKLYSVLIPCLIITALIELYVHYTSPELFEAYNRGNSFIRYILSASYLNEIWFFSAAPPMNSPLWSLSFEFWYYCLCAVFIYARHTKFFYLLLFSTCFIMGPKILLMMPIWVMGYFAYRMPDIKTNRAFNWIIGILFMLMPVLLIEVLPAIPFMLGQKPLYFANQFLTDYIVGIALSLGIWLIPSLNTNKGIQLKFNTAIRWLANLTFPLYLLHVPLFILYKSIFGTNQDNLASMCIAIFIILVASISIGHIINKTHIYWKRFFASILLKIPYKVA